MTDTTIKAPNAGNCTGNAQAIELRKQRYERAISEAPESVKNTLREAFSGSASPRKAIKAMCLSCVGYDRKAIRDCTGYSCPLWAYRPYQIDVAQE
jgi:hypothetical protein